MKKIILLIGLLFFTEQQWAQLPNGSIAPNFTATDINGNSHNLSTYLNSGKSVILDISANSCGPCWNYHKSQALQDLYNAYGPPGSDELMVFHIEDYDPSFSGTYEGAYNCLASGCGGSGNWIENTPFPIIISATLGDLYMIEYFPTIYRICPNGTTKLIGQASAYSIKSSINNECTALTGVQNYGKVLETPNSFCSTQGNFQAQFKNYGSNIITSAEFQLLKDGEAINTVTFTGSISQFTTGNITFDEITVDPLANYEVKIKKINGVDNFNPQYSRASLPFYIAKYTPRRIRVKIHTDENPHSISWDIKDSDGNIVLNAGPYADGGLYESPDALKIFSYTVQLPKNDCFTLNLHAADGYGWDSVPWWAPDTTPGVEIFSGGQLIYSNLNMGNFGSHLTVKNFLFTDKVMVLDTDETIIENFTIFPNPTTGIIRLTGNNAYEVDVYDIMGKQILHKDSIDKNSELDLSSLSNGIYIAKFTDEDNRETVRKIILDHK